jgi:hypothetical protein
MNYNVIKPIIGGLMLGTLLFFFPFFIVRIFGFFLILGLFFWLFKGRRSYWRKFAMVHPDKIRSMSDQDYEEFKTTFGRSHCGHHFYKYQDISKQANK